MIAQKNISVNVQKAIFWLILAKLLPQGLTLAKNKKGRIISSPVLLCLDYLRLTSAYTATVALIFPPGCSPL